MLAHTVSAGVHAQNAKCVVNVAIARAAARVHFAALTNVKIVKCALHVATVKHVVPASVLTQKLKC
jgi:hypothetical protein